MNERQIKNRQAIGLIIIVVTFLGLLIFFAINANYEIKEKATGIILSAAMILLFVTGFLKLK